MFEGDFVDTCDEKNSAGIEGGQRECQACVCVFVFHNLFQDPELQANGKSLQIDLNFPIKYLLIYYIEQTDYSQRGSYNIIKQTAPGQIPE